MKRKSMGSTLQLYFIDGSPSGMLTAEVFNWTGHVLMTPRSQIRTVLMREEATRTGVYILLGERLAADQEGETQAYIGKAEIISKRMRQHLPQEDMSWWETAVLVTSANNNLNGAHVAYLEARLVEEALAGGFPLHNVAKPARPSLSEADQANMEVFLDYLLMILPALRIDMFLDRRFLENERPATTAQNGQPQENESVVFRLKAVGIEATAFLGHNDDFVVREGSQARSKWVGNSPSHHYSKLYAKLVGSGVLGPNTEGNHRVFTMDWPFTSTSAAAAVVLGRPAAGPREWKTQGTNQTYGKWEAERLGQSGESE